MRSTDLFFCYQQKNNIRIQRSQALRVFRAAALKRFWNLGSPQGRKTLWGEEDAPQRRGLPVVQRRVCPIEAEVASDEAVQKCLPAG